ncbi:MAG: hypothetical protein HXX08_02930 [Chloroflexi bacterium]|uniref:UDENN FNIP1/2-type domain-containing protein n=1 Tax=Candidatus Chlorohelix allophototropha TaxID=3003348 RepID=A0A8T7LZ62_9CHLR|nr:hypothetical protein [Chloroflexota bacterium]WJW66692.1 hypothetical protein OZ401_002505 [Chloroflexota bacterium L227-S17]
MLEDYLQKIEKLSDEKLLALANRYRNTIQEIRIYRRDAEIVAFTTVVKYTDEELRKKEEELAIIQSMIEKRGLTE